MQPTPADLVAAHNPFDPAQMLEPHAFFAAARRETPIFFCPPLRSWIVTRTEDINAIYRDPTTFSSKYVMSNHGEFPPEVAAVFVGHDPWLPTLLTTDPPDHTRLRSLLIKAFAPQSIAAREPAIRALADELIDGFVADGEVDVGRKFAFPFTATVIGDMLGVPRADNERLKAWSDDWIKLIWCVEPIDRLVAAAHGLLDFQRYFADVLAERRRNPGPDVLSLLLQARLDDGDRLSERELVAVPMQLIIGGHETTLYAISNTLEILLERPELLAAVRADPGRLPKIVEEALRFQTPLHYNQRTTMAEVKIGDQTLPAGTSVMMMLSGANRDEAVFPEPDTFDPRRANLERHFAFGRGIHFCIGASLARLEMRVGLERLLTRLPGLRFHPDHPRRRAPVPLFHGFEHLHLAWDRDAA